MGHEADIKYGDGCCNNTFWDRINPMFESNL